MGRLSQIAAAFTGASPRARAGAAGGAVVLLIVLAIAASQVLGGGATATPSASTAATIAASASGSPTPTASPTDSPTPTPTATPSATPTPLGGYADLDGVAGPADKIHRLPLAMMIDDNQVARPQSGMTSASIVIQAPADGGEVRYLVIFQEGDAKDVGPVRSARPHFATWASEYKALLGHYGGDNKALTKVIPSLDGSIYNMDALRGGSCPYHRISTRVMPFNAYTNTDALRRCATQKGYPATVAAGLPVRPFTDDLPESERSASASITVNYPRQTVSYVFDPNRNLYLRSIDGAAEIDAAANQQVTARNVIVMFQPLSIDPESEPGHARPFVHNVGSGEAIVFHDGKAIAATWKKDSATALTRLFDRDGHEIPLVRGRIFIQVVATGTKVTHKEG